MFTAKHFDAFFMWLVSEQPLMEDVRRPGVSVKQVGRNVDALELFMTCKDFYSIFERNADLVYSTVGEQGVLQSDYANTYNFTFGRRSVFVHYTAGTYGGTTMWISTFKNRIPLGVWDRVPRDITPPKVEVGKNINARDFIRGYRLKLLR